MFHREPAIYRLVITFRCQPQIIRVFCSTHRFGPPYYSRNTSACPWLNRLFSGLPHMTCRSFKTRFRFGSILMNLTLPHMITCTPIMQKVPYIKLLNLIYELYLYSVSSSISLPIMVSFHLSLSVLVHYRLQNLFRVRRRSA